MKTRLTIVLEKDLIKAIKQRALDTDANVSDVVQIAVEDFLNTKKQENNIPGSEVKI